MYDPGCVVSPEWCCWGSRYATRGCKVQTPIVSSTPPHHKVPSDCRDDIITLTTSFIRRQLHIFSEFIRKLV